MYSISVCCSDIVFDTIRILALLPEESTFHKHTVYESCLALEGNLSAVAGETSRSWCTSLLA
jgi:hypothetical protein